MADQSQVTWMTQESYDRLEAELTELSTNGREEIASASRSPARRAT